MTGLYIVSRPPRCCGNTVGVGKLFDVKYIAPISEFTSAPVFCFECLAPIQPGELFGFDANPIIARKITGFPMYRLTRLEPDELVMDYELQPKEISNEVCR
jgi:hypothetical protein